MHRPQFFIIVFILILGFLVDEFTTQPFDPFEIAEDPDATKKAETICLTIFPQFYNIIQSGMGGAICTIPGTIVESFYHTETLREYVTAFEQVVSKDIL